MATTIVTRLYHPLRKLRRPLVLLYIVTTIPIVAVLLRSEWLRFAFFETVAGYWQKFSPPRYVFLGDSITAAGRNWGLRLDGNPLVSRTFAQNGYTTFQIEGEAQRAAELRPEWIFVMAGTNDVAAEDYDLRPTMARYRRILETARDCGARVVVTLAPMQRDAARNTRLAELNAAVAGAASELGATVVDINDTIAPGGVLLGEYTVDGVHPTKLWLDVWTESIRDVVRGRAVASSQAALAVTDEVALPPLFDER